MLLWFYPWNFSTGDIQKKFGYNQTTNQLACKDLADKGFIIKIGHGKWRFKENVGWAVSPTVNC